MNFHANGRKHMNAETLPLKANSFLYEALCKRFLQLILVDEQKALMLAEYISWFAVRFHPGRFSDGDIENHLLRIGRSFANRDIDKSRLANNGDQTLHVVSQLYETGGHTRILAKWIQRDLSSSHSIVTTRHRGALPTFLEEIARDRHASITSIDPDYDILSRAQQLRDLTHGYDRVILHHHPDDAVPVLAYAAPGGCPVAMFNHAHFWFSLGSGVADMIINTTPYFRELTERRRYPRATDILRGPPGLNRLCWSDIDKRHAKDRLGLSPDRPVVMTIGAEGYFTPKKEEDFFKTLGKLLDQCPAIQMIVVGVNTESKLIPSAIRDTGRVRFTGPVSDPRPYYEAADICLESFPMPSLGALIEAVAYGQAFPVPAFAEAQSPSRVDQASIAALAVRQRTEDEYIRYIRALLDDMDATHERAGVLRLSIIKDDETFGEQFALLYERLAHLGHVPHDLPGSFCATEAENLVLASFTDPSSFTEAINVLPFRQALTTHAHAVGKGYERPRTAIIAIARRIARTAFKCLPNDLQGRLRSTLR